MSNDRGELPYYAVEAGPLVNRRPQERECPICGKPGRWQGERFVPERDQAPGYPACHCRRIHEAGDGAYAYDPATRQFLRRGVVK